MLRAIKDWFRWAWGEWDRFWFTPVNASLLGIIRILAGAMIFYTHLVWTRGLDDFFGSEGWQRAELVHAVQDGMICPSFWWYVPDAWLYPVHYLCLAILAAFMLGLATRVTSILTFIIVVSYAYRTMCANFGLDQINALLAMYLAVGPSGRCWSIDALIHKWRGGREPPKSVTANISLRLIQLHLCIIYAYAGIAKIGGTAWWSGYAIWLAAANYEYQSWSLLWMADYPYLFNMLSHVAIAWELSFWSLVWHPRLRPIVLAIGVGMHLGIGAFLGMWTFGLAMIIAYFAFLPPDWFTKRLKRTPPPQESVDEWQGRLQAYIESYVESVSPLDDEPPTRVKEPAIVPAKRPQPIEVGVAPVASASARADSADSGGIFSSHDDAAETASVPRVLLVEPRAKNGVQLREALLKEGYRCQLVLSPDQAAQSLAVQSFDALIVNAAGMNRSQWNEFVSFIGDDPGPGLNFILLLQSWQWNWKHDLAAPQVRAIRYPSPRSAVVAAVENVS